MVTRTLLRASRRHLTRHPWQFGLAILGIALGVAVVVAVDLANDSARRAFRLSMEQVTGRATHQVLGGPAGIPEDFYATLRRAGLAQAAAPIIEGQLTLADRAFTLLGVDPFAEPPFRTFAPAPVGDASSGVLRSLLTQPGTLSMGAATARRLGLSSGDDFTIEVGGRESRAALAGVIAIPDAALLDGILIGDIATVQELLDRIGQLDRIDLKLTPAQVPALAERLPPGLRLVAAASRASATANMSAAFHLNLSAMSLLALLVGAFIVYNTMTFAVLQRRGLFGTLRTLGVTRGQVAAVILLESFLIGLGGTLLGLGLGVAIAQGLVDLVTRTIDDLYFTLTVTRFTFSPWVLAKGLATGIAVTLIAALGPAWEAARSQPRAVQATGLMERRVHRALPLLSVAGAALLGSGIALARVGSQALFPGFVALFLIVVGFCLTVPWLLAGLCRLLVPPAGQLFGTLGRLAVRGVGRAISRTGPAVTALTLAVATTVGVGIMIASFRATVALWIAQTLQSDIYVSAPAVSSRGGGELPAAVPALIRALPGVAEISTGRAVRVESRSGPVRLLAIRMSSRSRAGFPLKGTPLPRLWQRLARGELLLVSEPYAYRQRLAPGDRLPLLTDRGWRTFAVGGIFYDYGSDQGMLVVPRAVYERFWNDPRISTVGVVLRDPRQLQTTLQALRTTLARFDQKLRIRSNRAIRERTLEVFDRTFAVTRVLRLLAVGVALIGILSALMALLLERAREHALLRASGMTPRELFALVGLQTGFMGLVAGLLSLPLGWIMSRVLIQVINQRSFGWSMQSLLPPEVLVQALLLAVGAALLAGLYPAWRIGRTQPADALRQD